MSIVIKPINEKFKILYQAARYIVLYGGRGSAKSWAVVEALVYYAFKYKCLILCTREIQKSMKESSHRLIVNTIDRLSLNEYFEIQRDTIICKKTGSEFIFKGLGRNIDSIKSTEGIDITWVEEAQSVTQESLDELLPTIRKSNSMCIFTYNPRLPTDAVSQMFQENNPPPRTLIEKINYDENPCLSEVLKDEAEYCRIHNPSKYNHIWKGDYIQEGDDQVITMLEIVMSEQREKTIQDVPRVAGVDIARMGNDSTTIVIRQGGQIIHMEKIDIKVGKPLMNYILNTCIKYDVKKLIMDGQGVGGFLIDFCRDAKVNDLQIIEFSSSYKATNNRYYNARAEVYYLLKDWINDINTKYPKDNSIELKELTEELLATTYDEKNSQIILVPKDKIKDKIRRSPDMSDALAMTFWNGRNTIDKNKNLKVKRKLFN